MDDMGAPGEPDGGRGRPPPGAPRPPGAARGRLSAEPRGGARGRDRRGPGGRPAARELLDVALIFGDDWQTTNGFKRINDTKFPWRGMLG